MTDLPPIVLGPVLRRVEPRLVSVFVATSKPASVHLSLYDGIVDAANRPAEHAGADAHTMAFGARFHAIVVTIQIAGPAVLLPGHRYSYDLKITPEGGAAQTLGDLGLLSDRTLPGYGNYPPDKEEVEVCGLGYGDGQLPSFVTCPERLEDLVLVHSSCRKPHGAGNPALQWVDGLIDDLHGAEAGHPHMMFLTGDQIYADDVAAALLPGINALAIDLISSDAAGVEQVPSPAGGALNVNTIVLPAGFRQKMISQAGFTSEEAPSHLIGFGEWLAMYCISWTPELWPVLAVADPTLADLSDDLKARVLLDQTHSLTTPDGQSVGAPRVLDRPSPDAPPELLTPLYGAPDDDHKSEPDENQKALVAQFEEFLTAKERLDAFRREVPKIRRLLANVPTYMICDDHEVSDDWFLSGAIRAHTTKTDFGRAVLRNALAAYTVCQGWGDDPLAWANDPDRKAMLDGIAGMFGEGWNGGLPVASKAAAVDQALGLGPTLQPKFDFSFTVDGPAHRMRVLDTRTRRLYSTPFTSPGLLTPAAMDTQLPAEVLPDGHVLVVVSPAPVFGPQVITEVLGVLGASAYDVSSLAHSEELRTARQDLTGLPNGRPLGLQYFDAEHWGAHPPAFERLLERLSHFPRVVVLGGDVHYGAAFAMDWSGGGRDSRILHFTSSAAKNAWTSPVGDAFRNLVMLNAMSIGLQRIGLPMQRLGWSATLPPVVADLSGEPPLARIKVQTGPVLLTDDLFAHRHPLTRPPEWVWRAEPIVDNRPSAQRPTAAQVSGLDADIPAGPDGVHHYSTLVTAHMAALDTVALARGLQYLNNAGVIRFTQGADGLHASQSLYSLRLRPDPNEKGDAYIVHDSRLEPTPVAVPNAVGREG